MKYAKITIMKNGIETKMDMSGDSESIVTALTQGLLEIVTNILRDDVPVERAARLFAKDMEADFLKMAREKANKAAGDRAAEPDNGADDNAEQDEAVEEAVEFLGHRMKGDDADDFATFLESIAKRIKGDGNG